MISPVSNLRSAVKTLILRRLLGRDSIEARLVRRLDKMNIHTVFDVGANRGQFASLIRKNGFDGTIASFEPIRSVFEALDRFATDDPHHLTYNFALGHESGTADINLASNNGASSSILPFEQILNDELAIEHQGTENITIKSLDDFLDAGERDWDLRKTALKLDVQGFESQVLDGAVANLANIPLVYMETSFLSLYKGETLFSDMAIKMKDLGFSLVDIEPSAFVRGFKPLQCDSVFVHQSVDSGLE